MYRQRNPNHRALAFDRKKWLKKLHIEKKILRVSQGSNNDMLLARAGALVNTRTRAQTNVVIWENASRRATHAPFLGRGHYRWLVVAHVIDFVAIFIGLR